MEESDKMVNDVQDYIIGVIYLTLIIVGGLAFMSEMRSNSPEAQISNLDEFNDSFNKYETLQSEVTDLQNSVSTNSTGFFGQTFGAIEGLVSGAYNTLGLVFTSFSFVTSTNPSNPGILYSMHTRYGVPAWFPILLVSIIIIIIVFSIYKAVFQVG